MASPSQERLAGERPAFSRGPSVYAHDSAAADDGSVIQQSRDHPESFAVIFDRYFAEIHGYVARRLGDQVADDIAAETFVTAFRKRDQFNAARGTVRMWLYGIAARHVSRHNRTEVRAYRARMRVSVPGLDEGPENGVLDRVAASDLQRGLAGALAQLRSGDREVVLLVALAGLSHTEIAEALGIPYGTVGSRLNRARRKLRTALGGANPVHAWEEKDNG